MKGCILVNIVFFVVLLQRLFFVIKNAFKAVVATKAVVSLLNFFGGFARGSSFTSTVDCRQLSNQAKVERG
jgi:hypothetical protein